jgi:hypothetical protein
MTQTVSYKEATGMSVTGPIYGSLQTNTQAKVWKAQEIRNTGTGTELVTKHYVHLLSEIPKGSIIWLPGEDTDDNDAGHVVNSVSRYDSLAVRGTQWSIYVIDIDAT